MPKKMPVPGFRHEYQQVLVYAVGASAAAPRELFAACQDRLAERHDLLAVDGVHVVNEAEVADAEFPFDGADVSDHP